MNPLLRLAAIVLTIVTACFAATQLGGRAVFAQLPRVEGAVNTLLAGRGLQVRRLQGYWRGLNPGLSIGHVWFPAGEAEGFDFELDLLESLGRNRVVARRMTIADGHLAFERNDAVGWRLQGSRDDDAGFDVQALLSHSDQVWLRGRVLFRDGDDVGALHVDTMWINQDARHRFHVHLQPESRCDDCALLLEGDIGEDGAGAVSVAARRFTLGRELDALLLNGLSASSPFSAARFELALNADWRRDHSGNERARAQIDLYTFGLPNAPAEVGATLAAWRQADGDYRGNLAAVTLASDSASVRLTGGFALRGVDRQPALDFWLDEMAVQEVLAPVLNAIGLEHRTGLWLSKVAPRGHIEGLIARLDADGLAFHMRGSNAAVDDYRGMPRVDNMNFAAAGHQSAARLDFEGRDFEFAFPEYFAAHGPHERGRGSILFAFSPGFIGLRSPGIHGVTRGARADFRFALARPDDRDEVRAVVDGTVDRLSLEDAEGYMPKALSRRLRGWLRDALQEGEFSDIRILYRGHARRRGDLPVRRAELAAQVADGAVDYHPDWPAASAISGLVEITGAETRLRGIARAFDVALTDVALRVPHQARQAHVKLRGATRVERLFDFIRATPVQHAMPFLSDSWTGAGSMDFTAELTMPLQGQPLRDGDAQLDMRLENASLRLADLGLRFNALNNDVRFVFPASLASDTLDGTLFGEPVRLAIASDDDAIRFSLTGAASIADAYRLLDISDLGIGNGRFDFTALLSIFPTSDRATELRVESGLQGVDVALPAPLGKTATETRQLTASLQFLDTHVAVSARYGGASGWLHVDDAGVRAGAVGIDAPVPMIDADDGRVVFGGGIAAFDAAMLAALTAAADDGDHAPFTWQLRRFRVGALGLETVSFPDVVLNGVFDGNGTDVRFESPNLDGRVTQSGQRPWQVQLSRLVLPALASDDDPLRPETIDRLVPADVVLEQVVVGDDSYGSWRFGLRPGADGVTLTDVVGDIRGLHIESTDDVFWAKSGETRFDGWVAAANLKDVLPLWDFASSVESESFRAAGSLRWPGSPLNFDLHHLSGSAELTLDDGRFLDLDAGGARIMSLINFSTIAKRMSLDFSDVFGEGVSFDRVHAELSVDDGLASFTRPAEIVGTGSSFLLGGTVDLDSGSLNNEMVVTLPFLRSNLPWYAAFLAFSNPASAAGVWIGQQVLRNQINRLSSGKYHIGGTYEEPKVEFVGIFDNDVDIVPTPASVQADQQAVQ